MRDVFGKVLADAVRTDDRLFVLDGDCALSTRTSLAQRQRPDRFANVGIAEQNLVGVAAGLATVGLRPVVNSFAAMLVHRAHEQLMQSVGLPGLDVLVVGHYAGLSAAAEGAPHHAIADLALVRAVPGLAVWTPLDDDDAAETARLLLAPGSTGPRYLRLGRNSVAALPDPTWRGPTCRVWGPPTRVALVAHGGVVGECLAAQRALAGGTCPVRVVGTSRLVPFDEDGAVRAALEDAKVVLTVEEHLRSGGLGSVVLESGVAPGARVVRCGIGGFTQSGSHADLLRAEGIDAEGIARQVQAVALTGATRG